MKNKKYWMSEVPDGCEVCHKPFGKHFIDGSVNCGPWALMCETCHGMFGSGLGMGRGQKYLTTT
ncbi:MAG: hypothetical protein WCH76_07210, partial [Candidatus Riflemargulisbacteria bacterium]